MDEQHVQLTGVQGWLLLLCMCLTIFDPLTAILNIIVVTHLTRPHFVEQPGFLRLIVINGTCTIGLVVLSLYAGISLWRVLPGAVGAAKRYLTMVFLYAVVATYLPALVGLPEKLFQEVIPASLINGAITILYAAGWYHYLNRSKRVRATYTHPASSP
jgi:hypothetical protein